MHRKDVSAWQKAAELAEFQTYLRSAGQPHSTRDLAKLLEIPATRVTEQLTIATALDPGSLARYGVTAEELTDAEHRALLRIAKLPHYLRDKPIRDLARPAAVVAVRAGASGATVRENRRSHAFAKLRDEGHLLIDIPPPIASLSQGEAREYLDELLPAFAHLAEIVKGANRSHYIGLAGNGGIILYLAPAAHGKSD
jgi:hypothetical protein